MQGIPSLPFKATAQFQFFAENAAEISLAVGDIVTVIAIEDEGWWEGTLSNGKRGLFPSNYVIVNKSTGPPGLPQNNTRPAAIINNKQPAAPIVKAPIQTGAGGNKWAPVQATNQTRPQQIAQQYNNAVTAPAVGNAARYASNAPAIQQSKPRAAVGNLGLGESKEANTVIGGTRYAPQKPGQINRLAPVNTKIGLWAYNMAMITSLTSIIMGAMAIIWRQNDPINHNEQVAIVGAYTIGVGILTGIAELIYGKSRGPMRFPARGLIHIGLSIFQFFSPPTLLSGLFQATTGIVNIVSCMAGEVYETKSTGSTAAKSDPAAEALLLPSDTLWDGVVQWGILLKQQNKIGQLVFISIYIIGNIVLFSITVEQVKALLATLPMQDQLSDFAPYAKGFGAVLDLNCAMIVVPVLRTMLRYLYNRSTADQGCISRLLRSILHYIPVDMNLAFHKFVAKMIVLGTFGHVIIHFINMSIAYDQTLRRFGASPWYTGGIICYAMLFIYSAVPDNVKRGQFEIFWYCHHSFVVFFAVLLAHGLNGLNPNFWKYFVLPGTLYLIERCLRYWRASKPVVVLSVTLMDDVFSLEFAKEGLFTTTPGKNGYAEGQYLFLQCPAISRIEWHPFTISSAPDEKTVTVHIRLCGENSWTRQVHSYIGAMGPLNRPFFALDRQGPGGRLQGKIIGADGQQMICIDGPHSAPTQHLGEYSVAMIIGAGIGGTPVSAALKQIVFHKWKYNIGACFPDHAYFMWVCAHKDIDAFRWLIRIIKSAQDEVMHMRNTNSANMSNKSFEFHIWITSKPKDCKPIQLVIDDEIGFWGVPYEDDNVAKARADWDEADLYKTMKCPAKVTKMGDISVYDGRPDWAGRFDAINQKHRTGDIGVTFCGNPMIAHDLRRQCHRTNRIRQPNGYIPTKQDGLFKLHKENF